MTQLLHRAILSHLAVAVPPAVVLGLLVVDLNQRSLRDQAEQLHLSVAGRLRDTIRADVEARSQLLRHAERVLSVPSMTLPDKTRLLKTLVASQQIPWIALYGPNGNVDSVIRPKDDARAPDYLSAQVRQTARTRGLAVGDAVGTGDALEAPLAVPLKIDDEVRGYVVTVLDLKAIAPTARGLREAFLGEEGRLEIVDRGGRYLVTETVTGTTAELAPYPISKSLADIETGLSTTFTDPDGRVWLASLVSAPSLGWVVGSARPESAAFATLTAVRKRTFLLAIIAALLAGLVGLLFARAIAQPVRALAIAVRDSVKSGFEARVSEDGPAELAALGGAFNDTFKHLSRQRAELKRRTQIQLRLSRHLAPSELHELMSQDQLRSDDAKEEPVSVIYVDLAKGSELPSTLEPARLVDLLGDLYAESCAAIEQHGGRVDRFSGDAVIGLFPASLVGTPPQAAHRAALDMLARVKNLQTRWGGEGLAVAVGMVSQTGHVVSSGDGPELTVTGSLVEKAADLQQAAAPQSIEMDDASRIALQDAPA